MNETKWRDPVIFWLMVYLLLIPFDGLFRVVALKTNVFWINGWKDLLLLIILYVGFAATFFNAGQIRQRVRFPSPLLTASLFLLGIYGIAYGTIIKSISFAQGLWAFKIFYLPVMLFVLVQIYPANLKNDFPEKILRKLMLLSVPIVFFGVWQFFAGWQKVSLLFLDTEAIGGEYVRISTIGGFLRAFSTLRDSFTFGDYCSMLFIFSCGRLLFAKSLGRFSRMYPFVLLAGIIASTSRVSLITAGYGFLLLIFFKMPFRQNTKKVTLLFLMACFFCALLTLTYYLAYYYTDPRLKSEFLSSFLGTSSVQPRFIEWEEVLKKYPLNNLSTFLLGWGTGVVGATQKKFVTHYFFIDNFYLLMLIMFGVAGLSLWLTYILRSVWKLVDYVTGKYNRSSVEFWFVAGTAAYILSQFVEFLFRTGLEGFPGQIYFWVFLGLALRVVSLTKNSEPVNKKVGAL